MIALQKYKNQFMAVKYLQRNWLFLKKKNKKEEEEEQEQKKSFQTYGCFGGLLPLFHI